MDVSSVKSLLASRTVWGGILTVLSPLIALFGYTIDPALSQELANQLAAAVGVIGGLVSIFGRIYATKVIRPPKLKIPGLTGWALLALLVASGGGLTACASLTAETPQQKVFGLQADLIPAQKVIAAYVTRPDAEPGLKAKLQIAEDAAWKALRAAQEAVRSGNSPVIPALIAAAEDAAQLVFALVKEIT